MRENYYSKIVLCFKGSHQNKNPKGGCGLRYPRGGTVARRGVGVSQRYPRGVTFSGGMMFPARGGGDVARGALFLTLP